MASARPSLAKISRPRLYDAIPRHRLFGRLDALRSHPCIWVSAPPGAGKSTAVCSWLEARKLKGIWYQVDGGDADLSTFFYYLSRAAQALHPGKPELPLLSPEYLIDLPAFMRRYFRELFARLPAGGVLVLDNHHESIDSAPFQDMLSLAVREVPTGCNLIIVGRSDPPASMMELEANRMLMRLTWEEIKLTAEEARQIARADAQMSPDEIDNVAQRCGGWVAGLILMLRSHGDGAAQDNLAWHSRNAIFQYFATQYIHEVPEAVRFALLKTALVPAVTGSLAQALTGSESIEAQLECMCRKQFFTYRVGVHPAHYVYHDLFREFLIAQAQQQFSAAEYRRLESRAAQLLEDEGRPQDAYPLHLAAENWDGCLRVAIAQAPALLAQGRWRTLEEWISQVPQVHREAQSWSGYWLGLAQVPRDQTLAGATLRAAFEGFQRTSDRVGCALSAGAILESHYFSMCKWQPMMSWFDVLDTMLAADDSWLPEPSRARIYPAMAAGLTMLQPGHPHFLLYAERAAQSIQGVRSPTERAMACALLLNTFTVRGLHGRNMALIREAGLADALPGASPLANASLLGQLGFHFAMVGEPIKAIQLCERALSLAREYHLEPFMHLAMLNTFVAAANMWDYTKCRQILARMQATLLPSRELDVATLSLLQLWLKLAERITPLTAHELDSCMAQARSTGSDMYIYLFHQIIAGFCLEDGHLERAQACLETAGDTASCGGLECYDVLRHAVECRFAQLQGRHADAIQSLRALMSVVVSEQERVAFLVWLGPQTLANVLALAFSTGILPEVATVVVQRMNVAPPSHAPSQWPWRVRVHTLGGLRIEVAGAPLTLGKKSPAKVLALLKVLIALGGRNVALTHIADILWPDQDGDLALESAKVTLHRLRKLLGGMDLLTLEGGKLSINSGRLWVDVLALDRQAQQLGSPVDPLDGDFLPEDQDQAWSFTARKRYSALRERHQQHHIS